MPLLHHVFPAAVAQHSGITAEKENVKQLLHCHTTPLFFWHLLRKVFDLLVCFFFFKLTGRAEVKYPFVCKNVNTSIFLCLLKMERQLYRSHLGPVVVLTTYSINSWCT